MPATSFSTVSKDLRERRRRRACRLPVPPRRPAVGTQERREHAHDRCLASAVGPEQRHDRADVDLQVEVFADEQVAEALSRRLLPLCMTLNVIYTGRAETLLGSTIAAQRS
jgi:hypothetical protein